MLFGNRLNIKKIINYDSAIIKYDKQKKSEVDSFLEDINLMREIFNGKKVNIKIKEILGNIDEKHTNDYSYNIKPYYDLFKNISKQLFEIINFLNENQNNSNCSKLEDNFNFKLIDIIFGFIVDKYISMYNKKRDTSEYEQELKLENIHNTGKTSNRKNFEKIAKLFLNETSLESYCCLKSLIKKTQEMTEINWEEELNLLQNEHPKKFNEILVNFINLNENIYKNQNFIDVLGNNKNINPIEILNNCKINENFCLKYLNKKLKYINLKIEKIGQTGYKILYTDNKYGFVTIRKQEGKNLIKLIEEKEDIEIDKYGSGDYAGKEVLENLKNYISSLKLGTILENESFSLQQGAGILIDW